MAFEIGGLVAFDILTTPGILTDAESNDSNGIGDPRWFAAHGFKWLAYQVFNPRDSIGGTFKVRNLKPAKAAGMAAGVWGALYDKAAFFNDAKTFATHAVQFNPDFLIVDSEDQTMFTRANRGCKPIIDGLRAGGWIGPVHLTQMGCPVNHIGMGGINDYQVDEKSFLDTGGGILPQEYANEDASYAPKLALPYWLACKVPANRLNHMIALYDAKRDSNPGGVRYDGTQWSTMLRQAGIGCNFSVYMAEFFRPFDAEGLDNQTRLPPPVSVPPTPIPPDPTLIRHEASAVFHKWLDFYMKQNPSKPQNAAIIRLADRLVKLTGEQQAVFNEDLLIKELDRVGSPRT